MPDFAQIGQVVGWVGLLATAFTGLVVGVRHLIRGPKEDMALEAELQDKITAMAGEWLDRAEKRLKETEAQAQAATERAEVATDRAKKAEQQAAELAPRVEELEHKLISALATIDNLWPWGLNGGGEPRPKIPSWIFEWLHREGKGN